MRTNRWRRRELATAASVRGLETLVDGVTAWGEGSGAMEGGTLCGGPRT